ncbi:MAG: hypothetical protein AVDCRST_MAG73-1253, partial [uncultured Thermomicrobiales bacterium]
GRDGRGTAQRHRGADGRDRGGTGTDPVAGAQAPGRDDRGSPRDPEDPGRIRPGGNRVVPPRHRQLRRTRRPRREHAGLPLRGARV